MSELRLGIDLDGCVADFNYGFKNKLFEVTGKRLIGLNDEPPCWDYPQAVGYTKDETNAAWENIKADPMFWATLRAEPGGMNALQTLSAVRVAGHEVYFITTRMGAAVHQQSQYWVHSKGFVQPTVLIARNGKGLLAKGLGLTHFVDDKPSNVFDVRRDSPDTKVWLLERNWNRAERAECVAAGVRLAPSMQAFLREVQEDAIARTAPAQSSEGAGMVLS